MCAEDLNSKIRRNEDAGLLHRCTIPREAPTISHLLFTDVCGILGVMESQILGKGCKFYLLLRENETKTLRMEESVTI